MPTAITAFRGKYGWLSNFYSAPVAYDGHTYATVEHAYQAAKTLNKSQRSSIRNAFSPGIAKKRGKRVTQRANWQQIKLAVMLDLLRQKFSTYAYLRNQLIATGDTPLQEGNNWHDTWWGVVLVDGQWCGQNMLGKLLMQVRDELIAAQNTLDRAA